MTRAACPLSVLGFGRYRPLKPQPSPLAGHRRNRYPLSAPRVDLVLDGRFITELGQHWLQGLFAHELELV